MSKLTEKERKALIAKAKEDYKNAPKLSDEDSERLRRKWKSEEESFNERMIIKNQSN